jgi:6-phosphogluconolactonase
MIRVVAKDAERAAANAAQWIASALREDLAARGSATLAISGGSTTVAMLQALSRESLPWALLRVAQVDERIVPAGDSRSNLSMQRLALVDGGPLPAANLLAMPVDNADAAAMDVYGQMLGTLDIVQLGLGVDGHTASLVPGDPVLQARAPVALSELYQGTRRMTLTFPVINAARRIVWLVTGASKRAALAYLLAGKRDVPALQVRRSGVVVFADVAAAGAVETA